MIKLTDEQIGVFSERLKEELSKEFPDMKAAEVAELTQAVVIEYIKKMNRNEG